MLTNIPVSNIPPEEVVDKTDRGPPWRIKMSGSVVSFTTVEYPDEGSMQKAREVFQQEMGQLAEKLRPLGMTKFHSSRLFLPEDRFIIGNWLEYRDMAAYEACDKVWQQSGAEFAEKYGDLFEGVTVTPHRGEVMDDYS